MHIIKRKNIICENCGSGNTYVKAQRTIVVCRKCGNEENIKEQKECLEK